MKLNCPACGAELSFRSRVSVFAVCTFCSSMVVRHDLNLETMGKMAELPPDLTPFLIGTRGRYESSMFELVGRLKIGWKDGSWNEWYAIFADGREGWLAEAQGSLMMTFPQPLSGRAPEREKIAPGLSVVLGNGQRFVVEDIKMATCLGSEGELPFKSPKGRESLSVDLRSESGGFATLDYSEEGVRLYLGRHVDFDSLAPAPLREIDGW